MYFGTNSPDVYVRRRWMGWLSASHVDSVRYLKGSHRRNLHTITFTGNCYQVITFLSKIAESLKNARPKSIIENAFIVTMPPNLCVFAFILNTKGLPNPFLVEIGCRRAALSSDGIQFFEPNVLYCPQSMSQIPRRIRSSQHFNVRNYKQIIKDKFVGVLLNVQGEDKPCHFWHDLAIHTVIKYELNKKLGQSKTRSKSAKIQMIKKWISIYKQRKKKRVISIFP